MKNPIDWKLFWILLAGCLVTSIMVMPYAFTLADGFGLKITPILIAAQIGQSAVLFSLLIFLGLRMAKQVGFGLPYLEGMLRGENQCDQLMPIAKQAAGLGVLASALIILFSLPFGSLSLDFLKAEIAIPTWKTFLASFYGGIAEEVLLRLFFMTLIVWVIYKFKKTAEGKSTTAGIWFAIIFSSIIFGLGHLPITGGVTAITGTVVLRAILLNGVAGIIFGWLYWKKGLESAMISHFTADICLHVILPLVAAQII